VSIYNNIIFLTVIIYNNIQKTPKMSKNPKKFNPDDYVTMTIPR